MNLKKYILPKNWTETKISEDSYFINIPQEEIEKWQVEKWKKDKVYNLMDKDGFHLKPDGRSGTIYYVEKEKLCQIYFEISGVKEFDILVFFERLTEWELPKNEIIDDAEKERIREKLILWLKGKRLRSDL